MMKHFGLIAMSVVSLSAWSNQATAQCKSWAEGPQGEEAKTLYVVANDAAKIKDFVTAFPNWKKSFEMAPSADKKTRTLRLGRDILKGLLATETNADKKKEYADLWLKTYEVEMNCFGQSDAEASKILGRKGYDMLYELKMPMEEVYTVFKNALAKGGNASEYLIFAPMTATIADQFSKGKISKDEARDQYVKLTDAVDYNIANPSDPKYKTYYVSAKDAMTAQIAAVENQIFDCAYFKDKYAPVFEKYRDSFDRVKEIYVKLRTQGCAEDDAFVVKVKTRYDEMAVVIMESQKEEFYKANPAAHAKDLAEEGKYGEAVNKYEEAIGKETDNEKKAVYAYQIAVLQRKRGSLSAARESARTAAKYKPGWGMPWLLIGDMYSSSASDFGDPLQRSLVYLAAIEKYQYARSIDGEVADECSRRISQASRGLLPKEDFFMRGLKEGASATAPGWIGESVKMKYAN